MKKIILITAILYLNWSWGQQTKIQTFSGKFENGTATYSYFENDNYERIYNGQFEHKGSIEYYENLDFTFKGNFLNNLKEGKWIFSIKNINSPVFKLLSHKEKSMIQLGFKMGYFDKLPQKEIQTMRNILYDGKAEVFQTFNSTISGNYVVGKLNGEWIFKVIFTGGKEDNLIDKKNGTIISTVSFKDNHLIGNFTYHQDKKNFVLGQFNSNGNLDGKWTTKWVFEGNEFENISEYENGILIKMIERNSSTGEILFRDIQTKSTGFSIMAEKILFWINYNGEFNQTPISKINYMYKFDKGIIKPEFNYNF